MKYPRVSNVRLNSNLDIMNFQADGRAEMKNLLGGKGANLAEMASIGLPVPPGFTLTTEVCTHFYQNGCQYPKELEQQAGLQDNSRRQLVNFVVYLSI